MKYQDVIYIFETVFDSILGSIGIIGGVKYQENITVFKNTLRGGMQSIRRTNERFCEIVSETSGYQGSRKYDSNGFELNVDNI